jgi:hypothetical protein
MATKPSLDSLQVQQQALMMVLDQLLQPMAQLCLAKGVSIQAIEEVLRRAYVRAAQQGCAGLKPSRSASRISTMTGLTRREVARLQSEEGASVAQPRSVATDVLTHWASHPEYVNKKGLPICIPRTGRAPSFEALAAGVTKDVHPKSILADMVRLGLVSHNEKNDMVELLDAIYVPRADWAQMVGFIGANVGGHLQASVENVLDGGNKHFEQALLADELSKESLEDAKVLITEQWRELLTQLGPQLQALMDQDKVHGRQQNQQLRIGLYSYMNPMHLAEQVQISQTAEGTYEKE